MEASFQVGLEGEVGAENRGKRQVLDVLAVEASADDLPAQALQVHRCGHLVDVDAHNLLVERTRLSECHGQSVSCLREDGEDGCWREGGNLGEVEGFDGVDDLKSVAGVDEAVGEVEETILDGATEDEGDNVATVGTEEDVMCGLVDQTTTLQQNLLLVDIVYTQDILAKF